MTESEFADLIKSVMLRKNSSDSVLQLTPSTFRNLFSWVSDLVYNSSSCVNSAGFVASFQKEAD